LSAPRAISVRNVRAGGVLDLVHLLDADARGPAEPRERVRQRAHVLFAITLIVPSASRGPVP